MDLYSVKDLVSDDFSMPVCMKNDAVAVRWLKRGALASQDADPADYRLYRLGSFDEDTGMITVLETPHPVVREGDIEEEMK